MFDAVKIAQGTADSLNKNSPYYERQIAALMTPGFDDTVLMVATKARGVQDAVLLGVRLGVYLEIKNEELRKLKKLIDS